MLVSACGSSSKSEDETFEKWLAKKPAATRVEPKAEQEPEQPPNPFDPNRSRADLFFVMFLNDPDHDEAWSWLCLAATNGHAVAQNTLATRYRDGLSPVEQDPVRAYYWYSAASKNGLSAATISRDAMSQRMTARDLKEAQARVDAGKPGSCALPDGG